MNFELADILKAIGPSASIIFAAWIFVGFLQQRYDSAVERYRAIIGQYRTGDISDERRGNIRDQVSIYRRRCELMNSANIIGIISAMMLILTLIAGELDVIFPSVSALKYVSAGSALIGFVLVIAAAALAIVESSITHRQLDGELLDVPDLAQSTGQEFGDITHQERRGRSGLGRLG
jgi:hypothetical protein